MDIGIFILRVVVGFTMAAHGSQKLFGWFKGPGLAGTAGWLGSLGFRPAKPLAGLLGTSESVGGLFLAIGLFSPLAAATIIGSMIAAIAVMHWKNGFFNGNGGYELNVLLSAGAAAVAFAGPGRYSIDAAFGLNLAGAVWGVASVVIGAATAMAVLNNRAPAQPAVEEVREEAKAA